MVVFSKAGIGKVSSMVVMDSGVLKSKNISLGYMHLIKEKGLYFVVAKARGSDLVSVNSGDLNRSNEND